MCPECVPKPMRLRPLDRLAVSAGIFDPAPDSRQQSKFQAPSPDRCECEPMFVNTLCKPKAVARCGRLRCIRTKGRTGGGDCAPEMARLWGDLRSPSLRART